MSHKVFKASKRQYLSMKVRVIMINLMLIIMINLIAKILIEHEYILKIFNDIRLIQYLQMVKLCLIIFLVLLSIVMFYRYAYTKITKRPYAYLIFFQSDKWLQDVGLYLKNGDNFVEIPKVRKISSEKNEGIEIEILGDLRDKMLDLNESLTSYIRRKGSDWFVVESYEIDDGFIRYVFVDSIAKTRIKGLEDEL